MKQVSQSGASIFERFFEESTDYIALIPVDALLKPTAIHLNPAACKVLGIRRNKNLLTLTLEDIYPTWSRDIILRKAFPRIIEKGVWRGKIAVKNREGEEIPISQKITAHKDAQGNVQFFSSIARNIAEFRKKEQESKLYETTLSEHISDAVIITDTDFVIKSWNKAAEDLYGWKKQDVINRTVDDIIPPTVIKENRIAATDTLHTKGTWRGEVFQKRKDGRELSISSSVSSIKDLTGKRIGYIAINRDITASKELERRKDDFINMASHELKTPLTSFKIYMQILRTKSIMQHNGELNNFFDKMNRQLQKFSSLVEELLDVTRIEKEGFSLNKQRFSLDALFKEIIEEIQPTIRCTLIARGNVHMFVYADKKRMQQVITNLVMNAVKFSLQHGEIILTAHKRNAHMEVSIQDFGMGIAQEHHTKIFDRFYRIKEHRTYPGLGLGLYISSQIVKAHKGRMWVKSEPGKGSIFYFTLPL